MTLEESIQGFRMDTFYVGKLKGVGKVWQITGCDAASSYTWAHLVIGEVTGAAVWQFVDTTIRPGYRAAGWKLQRVLTDGGHEFKGVFVAGCERRGIRLTRTNRVMPGPTGSSNGFKERSCMSIGGLRFVASTSRAAWRCSARSIGICGSTTSSVRIGATDSRG